jgi:hypothetical protein
MRSVPLTLTSSPDRDTARAGFRPLGVRGPAISLPNARADRSTVGPGVLLSPGHSVGFRSQSDGSMGGPTAIVVMRLKCLHGSLGDARWAPMSTIAPRSTGRPSTSIESPSVETLVTGRLHPRSRGRPEPPPPGVPHVLDRARRVPQPQAQAQEDRRPPDGRPAMSPFVGGGPAGPPTKSVGQPSGGRVPPWRSKSV